MMKTFKNPSALFVAATIFATAFIFGCQKEQLNEAASVVPTSDANAIYLSSSLDGTGAFEKLDYTLEELSAQNGSSQVTSRTGNSHAHGHYSNQVVPTNFYKTTTYQINATENSQGLNGGIHIWRTWGENGENAFEIIAGDLCYLESNGSEAVLTGIVTEAYGVFPSPFGAPTIGVTKIFLKVKDNGNGANVDMCSKGYLTNPSGGIPCDAFGINSILWTLLIGMENVADPSDQIKVN